MHKQRIDQVGIYFEWHHGAQFHQGKQASKTFRLATIAPLLQTVKIDSLFPSYCIGIILEIVSNA